MTALAITPSHTAPLSRRILNVVRLHLANPFTIIGMPLMILGIIFAANWAIWLIIAIVAKPADVADAAEGLSYSGASFWIFVYMMVVAIQAMNLTFSLALGFSSTRRDFYLGSVLTFLGLSVFYAAIFGTLAAIEQATNGWGLNGRMFTSIYFGLDSPIGLRYFFAFCAFVFFFFIGAAIASTYVRWKQRGLLACLVIAGFLLIGGAALISLTGSWPAVGSFFTTIGFLGGFSLSLVVSALAGWAGYLVMRRATPRS
ncbi:MAG: hypothetical protein ABIR17_08830 [Pseudolysinimonas sp.]|uniref:hypothetical protein n=1 Tax=Pseudolysinimonas sp. TaxID=2680009 RepID=UPI003263F4B1